MGGSGFGNAESGSHISRKSIGLPLIAAGTDAHGVIRSTGDVQSFGSIVEPDLCGEYKKSK